MKTNTNNQAQAKIMTFNEAEQLVKADLDALRLFAHNLTIRFKQSDNSRWIGGASKKQLLAEIIRLLTNNHEEVA